MSLSRKSKGDFSKRQKQKTKTKLVQLLKALVRNLDCRLGVFFMAASLI
jgi:hypothetical protein